MKRIDNLSKVLPKTQQDNHIYDPLEAIGYATNANHLNQNGREGFNTAGFY